MNIWKPSLEFAERVKSQKIRTSDFDALDATMMRAWENPHKWIAHPFHVDGITAVICVPKVSKTLTRYWLWGYRMTIFENGKPLIHWQNTRYPYVG
jgi:hypothetical protein